MPEQTDGFSEWAILELMGHRRLGGIVSQAEVGGIPFLRIDVYRSDATIFTQFYGKAAVYCLTPTTEEVAKAVARTGQEPLARWEFPQITEGSQIGHSSPESRLDDSCSSDEYADSPRTEIF